MIDQLATAIHEDRTRIADVLRGDSYRVPSLYLFFNGYEQGFFTVYNGSYELIPSYQTIATGLAGNVFAVVGVNQIRFIRGFYQFQVRIQGFTTPTLNAVGNLGFGLRRGLTHVTEQRGGSVPDSTGTHILSLSGVLYVNEAEDFLRFDIRWGTQTGNNFTVQTVLIIIYYFPYF